MEKTVRAKLIGKNKQERHEAVLYSIKDRGREGIAETVELILEELDDTKKKIDALVSDVDALGTRISDCEKAKETKKGWFK
jgi:DNA-binding PadR family transcriptional regulator